MLKITIILLIISMLTTSIRMVFRATIWDKLLALNLISAKTILLLAVYAVYKDNIFLLDLSISCGIIGFLGITLLSRFILRGGRQK
ncbi:MAG: pH regulation protein F [Firmicutes bacterium]|nr:pH regulation protein F [Bacillota bacterium]